MILIYQNQIIQVKFLLNNLTFFILYKGSPYSEGGSLYALGLIHANHGSGIISYITNALHSASGNEIVQHGACLGLGISAMATGNFFFLIFLIFLLIS